MSAFEQASGQGRQPEGLGWILRHTDIALAGLVVAVVGMMILPLPTWLVDMLIAMNLAMGVTLLLAVLYVSEPLAIATFPTILLLTTLFRLSLNISTTRLILLQADAGRIIDAFGNFVVAGNYVVGGVVFLIITLVQFIVIARGSERVAEVAARFTLDAMPGKQMSIDADLRSGVIDQAQARSRRRTLEREAQFHGAMDGAMKFVKGDAIAGICITCVNILAGLVVGVFQMDMSAGEALQVYSLLTIGDGLVSQIPALVTSTAAGFLITRVASEETGSHLGADIGRQILAQPKALRIAAVILVGLGLVPGLPAGPFVALGLLTGILSYSMDRGSALRATAERLGVKPLALLVKEPEPAVGEDDEGDPLLAPVILEVLPRLAGTKAGERGSRLADVEIPAIRARLFEDLGLRLPAVKVRTGLPSAPDADFVVLVAEVPASRGRAPEGKVFCSIAPRDLLDASIDCDEGHDPLRGVAGAWVDASLQARVEGYGCRVLDPVAWVAACLEEAVRSNAPDLVGVQQVQDLLDDLERTHPALVRTTVPKPVELRLLADVCRRLVEEGVSLRHMAEILQALGRWAGVQKDPVALTELVRAALTRPISARHVVPGSEGIEVFVLSPAIEDAIRSSIHRTDQGSFLALDPAVSRDIVEATAVELRSFPWREGRGPVVLVQSDVRRFYRKLIEVEHPRVAVLSYQEIDPRLAIQPVSEIKVQL